MFKQIGGAILLLVFIGFLGNKFYDAVKDMQHASFIIYLCCLVLLLIIIGVGKQLRGY